MNHNRKIVYLLSLCLTVLMLFSACVVAVPVSEQQLNEVGEKIGVGDAITDIVKGQFDYEMDENGNAVQKEVTGRYALHIMTSEEKDDVKVVNVWNGELLNEAFVFGSDSIGYLQLPNAYKQGESTNCYILSGDDNSSIEITIDGFTKDSELNEWVEFITGGLQQEGYTDITTKTDETDAYIHLNPNELVDWNIYLHEENERIYLTEIVCVSKTPEEGFLQGILDNRYYNKDENVQIDAE